MVGGNRNHWINSSWWDQENRDAIGATVTVAAGDLVRDAAGEERGQLSFVTRLRLLFGLGARDHIDSWKSTGPAARRNTSAG